MTPPPQHIRTWQDAEQNAAAWMRHWGFADARVTPGGADEGVDVRSRNAIAQVKFEAAQVGRPALQRLVGARGLQHHQAMFFFSGAGFSVPAVQYADELGISLFQYSLAGEMTPVNRVARTFLAGVAARAASAPAGQAGPATAASATSHAPTGNQGVWRLIVGLFFLVLTTAHVSNGALTNPISLVLDVVVFGGAGVALIRWWHLRRQLRRCDVTTDLPGPSGAVLAPGLVGTVCAFGAVDTVLDALWTGKVTGDQVETTLGLGGIGLVLLTVAVLLYRRGRRDGGDRVAETVGEGAERLVVEQPEAGVPSQRPEGATVASPAPAVAVSAPYGPEAAAVAAHRPEPAAVASPAPGVVAVSAADPEIGKVGPAADAVKDSTPEAAEAAPHGAQVPEIKVSAEATEALADFLRDDARTAWAYRRYLDQRAPGGITAELGRALLFAIQPGDHAEFIADAALRADAALLDAIDIERTARAPFVAARTLRSWIFLDRSTGSTTVVPGGAWNGSYATTSPGTTWPDTGWATVLQDADGRPLAVKVFLDDGARIDEDIISNGAGEYILRLPEAPAVPAMPDLESLPTTVGRTTPASVLPADWRTAEEIACAHLHSLGFTDAETTTSGRDGGLDVVAQHAVAQVKMLAQPVGAPPVQQLRGTRPHVRYHLFYSTSGYTPAAVAAAGEIGVALFRVAPDGSVTGVNDHATALAGVGVVPDEDQVRADRHRSAKQLVEEYANGVAERIMRAVKNTDLGRAREVEKYDGQFQRTGRYLKQALENLEEQPSFGSLKSALVYYHHTELLAHVHFQELGIPYPEGAGNVEVETLEAYYG
ncbi:restriction endonuclease [Micromonospora sp. DPT]|uniref:restriction endonuclease n=1 Tax=Micromonospora sp. DPT TaxID=3142975 RepID=UPI00320A9CA2